MKMQIKYHRIGNSFMWIIAHASTFSFHVCILPISDWIIWPKREVIGTMKYGSPSKDFVQFGAPLQTHSLHSLSHVLINNSSVCFFILWRGSCQNNKNDYIYLGDVQIMLRNVCEFQLKRCHFAVHGLFHLAIVFYILTTFTTFTAAFLFRRFNKMKTRFEGR